MLFLWSPGWGGRCAPCVCGPPRCCSGLHKRRHALLCFAAKQLLPRRMREVFKYSSEVQRRLREGVQRERGWGWGWS